MKIFAAGIFTETNTFSPIPTGMADFNIVRSNDLQDGTAQLDNMIPFSQWKNKAEIRKDELVFGLFAWANPAGVTASSTYEDLRDEILLSLRSCDSVDIVLLFLHGAMVAQGYDDCEGDLIKRIRQQVGVEVIIAAELDLHCHLTTAMIENSNIIITYKEYPHVDVGARGDELFDLAIGSRLNNYHPMMAFFDCKMVGMYPTSTPDMQCFIEQMREKERTEGVLSVSFCHGFPYGDLPDAGGKLLVVTNNNLPLAKQIAEELGLRASSLRYQINFNSMPMKEALTKAVSIAANAGNDHPKPVVVADQSDNPGAGAPSDSTFALKWLLDHKVQDAAIAIFCDPQVVKLANSVGVGASLKVRLGGKMGLTSGDPLDLSVKVIAIKKNYVHLFPQSEGEAVPFPIGDTVAISCLGIDVVVSTERCQCFSPCIFDDLRIPVSEKKLLVIKSTQHFYGGFSPIASDIIYMAGPGAVSPNVRNIPYSRMTTEDKFPWLDNPFS